MRKIIPDYKFIQVYIYIYMFVRVYKPISTLIQPNVKIYIKLKKKQN